MVSRNPVSEEFAPLFQNLMVKYEDEAFVIEILSIFVVDGTKSADKLNSALMLSDAPSIKNSLHSLKNIHGTLQAARLFQLAERAAEAFRTGHQEQGQTDAAALISETRRLVLAAEIYIGELQKATAP